MKIDSRNIVLHVTPWEAGVLWMLCLRAVAEGDQRSVDIAMVRALANSLYEEAAAQTLGVPGGPGEPPPAAEN